MKKNPMPATGAHVAKGGGKNSVMQDLGSPHSGMKATVTKGDPMSRAMGQLGKGHSFAAPPMRTTAMVPNPRRGGLNAGGTGTPAPAGAYALASPDTESTV